MICEDCGESNKAGSQFCLFCGAYLDWQDSDTAGASEVTQQLPPVASAPSPAAAPPPAAAPVAAQASVAAPTPPVAQPVSPAPTQPLHQPTPLDLTPDEPAAGPARGCPTCGRPVDTKRRFCAHCGEQFVKPGAEAPVSRPVQKRDTWWTRLWNSKDRAARRAYRRSLPPLYRWRRVIISVLALGLIGGGLTVVGRSPKAFFMTGYYNLRKTFVVVPGVQAKIIPPDGSAANSTPDALLDGTAKPWKMAWSATTQGKPCNVTQTTPVIELTFPETRVRRIEIWAGLLQKNPNRQLEFRPKTIWIAYADQCKNVDLQDIEKQEFKFDTKTQVTSIRISVQTAYPPDPPDGAAQLMSFTEIALKSHPPIK